MPRKPRQFEIGKIYHIISRGVDKRTIFLKDQDYSRFILGLELFNSYRPLSLWDLIGAENFELSAGRIKKHRERKDDRIVDLLAFALMPNHYHLILREIAVGGTSLFMKKIGGYSTYFNRQYERSGSLFQSRYKLVPIETDEQLNTVFCYVHTNPIEIVESGWKKGDLKNLPKAQQFLKEYRQSSLLDYSGINNFPNTIQKEFFLDFYNMEKGCQKAIDQWIRCKAKNQKDQLFFLE